MIELDADRVRKIVIYSDREGDLARYRQNQIDRLDRQGYKVRYIDR